MATFSSPFPPSDTGMKYFPQHNGLVSPTMLYGPPVAYLALALWGHRAMKTRETPSWVATCVRAYNVVQIVACLYMTVGLAPVLGFPNIFGIGSKCGDDAPRAFL